LTPIAGLGKTRMISKNPWEWENLVFTEKKCENGKNVFSKYNHFKKKILELRFCGRLFECLGSAFQKYF
jgi:hypothetical protein